MNKAFDTKKLNSEKAFVIDAYSSITPKIELTFDYFEEAEKYVKNQSWLSDGTNLRACTEEKARESVKRTGQRVYQCECGIGAGAAAAKAVELAMGEDAVIIADTNVMTIVPVEFGGKA